MSGEPEIEQWFDENYEVNADDDPLSIIEMLDKKEDFRALLVDIFPEDMPKFIGFLQERINLQKTIRDLEKELSSFDTTISNILGTPIR